MSAYGPLSTISRTSRTPSPWPRYSGRTYAVRERAREADLGAVVVDAGNALGFADEALDHLIRPASRPVRLVGEIVVDGRDVDPPGIVVELERHGAILAGNG